MPSLRILTKPLAKDRQEDIAKALTRVTIGILKVPIVKIYFQEYESYFSNGERQTTGTATILVEGPDVGEDVLDSLCASITKEFRVNCGEENYAVSFVYHNNDHQHVGANGVLLSKKKKRC